jgi:nitrate reductase delta subunit
MLYRLISKSIDYPDAALLANLQEWRGTLTTQDTDDFSGDEWVVLDQFLSHLTSQDVTEAQAAYVQTFDLTPEHALHLTHHLFGDDKNRGPALIDLTEFYKEFGLEMRTTASTKAANDEIIDDGKSNELPDFLPVILEFASLLEKEEAHLFLSRWSKVLNVLAKNLEDAGSPYAPLIRLVEQRSLLVKAAA